jgi:hypothetical protein
MKTYQVFFTTTAVIRVEVTVQAESQTEGIVAAHDAVRQAASADACIVSMSLDRAVFESACPVEAGSTEPTPQTGTAGQLEGTQDTALFTVVLYEERNGTGRLVSTRSMVDFKTAKKHAVSAVTGVPSLAGSATIQSILEGVLALENAERGGWEVEVWTLEGTEPNLSHRESWLQSQGDAMRYAGHVLNTASQVPQEITILDYTRRSAGPKLWKKIG